MCESSYKLQLVLTYVEIISVQQIHFIPAPLGRPLAHKCRATVPIFLSPLTTLILHQLSCCHCPLLSSPFPSSTISYSAYTHVFTSFSAFLFRGLLLSILQLFAHSLHILSLFRGSCLHLLSFFLIFSHFLLFFYSFSFTIFFPAFSFPFVFYRLFLLFLPIFHLFLLSFFFLFYFLLSSIDLRSFLYFYSLFNSSQKLFFFFSTVCSLFPRSILSLPFLFFS